MQSGVREVNAFLAWGTAPSAVQPRWGRQSTAQGVSPGCRGRPDLSEAEGGRRHDIPFLENPHCIFLALIDNGLTQRFQL